MEQEDFATLSQTAKEQTYLQNATPRERVWYMRQKALIALKFNNEIEPLPIELYRRKRTRFIGQFCGDKIRLHNKYGCTRSTLLHELVHHYLRKKAHYTKSHVQEFYDLLKYLKHGGNVVEYYGREIKLQQKAASCKAVKRSVTYKLDQVRARIKTQTTKLKRASTLLKKLKVREKYLIRRESDKQKEVVV